MNKKIITIYMSLILAIGFVNWQNIIIPNENTTKNATITAVSAYTWASVDSGVDIRNMYINKQIMQKMFFVTSGNDQIHIYLRKYIVSQMISNKFAKFAKQPNYWFSNIYLKLPQDKKWFMDYQIAINVSKSDNLDYFIDNYIYQYNNLTNVQKFDPNNFADFVLPYITYSKWTDINLYKNQKDLADLGYILTSFRTRINKDDNYRRHNISKAFGYFGNTRVINIGESIYYMDEIQYDPQVQQNYMSWLSIVADDEIPTYGWWLCGSSTAIYQWTFTNKWLTIRSRPHSKRRTSLYAANINWELVKTPWLDSTIYSSKYDLVITNNTDHPIIMVNNFDGKKFSQEQNFTIWRQSDVWSYSKWKKSSTKTTKSNTYKCYNRIINNKSKQSCYNEIDNKEVK